MNKEKICADKKQYYNKNKEEITVKNKKYYGINKEEIDAWRKKHYNEYKEEIAAYKKKHYEANKEEILTKQKEYYDINKEKLAVHKKQYREMNKDKISAWGEQYREANKDRIANYAREQYKTNIAVRITTNLRGRVHKVLKGINKSDKTMKLIGCNRNELLKHLEAQFQDGMSWDNYGFYGWHIDHIKPCSSFNLIDPAEQRKCFHYTNLQPLWAEENLAKRDKLEWISG